jgi:hypothetical protein
MKQPSFSEECKFVMNITYYTARGNDMTLPNLRHYIPKKVYETVQIRTIAKF